MTDRIICPLLPPAGIVNLNERQVSNGFLPDVVAGVFLAFAMLTAAGQQRSHSVILGSPSSGSFENLTITSGSGPTFGFLLKPGARTVVVDLLFQDVGDTVDGGDPYEITVRVVSRSVTRQLTYGFTTTGGLTNQDLETAIDKQFIFEEVGLYPGQLANRDEDAYIQIIPDGADLKCYGLSIWQLHTEVILQDSP